MFNTDWMEVSILIGVTIYYFLLFYIIYKTKTKRKEILVNQTYLIVWMFIAGLLITVNLFELRNFISQEIMRIAMFGGNLYLVVSAIGKLLAKNRYTWSK